MPRRTALLLPLLALLAVGSAVALLPGATAQLVANTLWLALGSVALAVPLGTLLAVLLARCDLPLRGVLGAALVCLLFLPLYLHAAGWQAGFSYEGWYTLARSGTAWLIGWPAAVWVHGMAAVPWVVLIVAGGLRLVEADLEEQALLDAPPHRVFFFITLRRALPAVALAALWVALLTAGEIAVTDLFQVRTYAEVIYTEMAVERLPGQAPLTVLPGMLVVAGLIVAALVACAALLPATDRISLRSSFTYALGRWRWPAWVIATSLVALLAALPLGSLVWKAGVVVQQLEQTRVRSWSLLKFAEIVLSAPWQYRGELGWSLLIGGLAAIAAVAVAIPLVWMTRRGGWRMLPALLAAATCLAVPGPIVGLTIIWLLNRPDSSLLVWLYDRTIVPPLMAQWFKALPLAIFVLWQPLRNVPRDVLDLAQLDGTGFVARWWHIILPQRRAALAAAALVAFAASLAELGASLLVVPPGITTVTIRIFGLLHYGVEDHVAGICLALCSAMAVLALLVGWFAARCWQTSPRDGHNAADAAAASD